MDNLNAPLVEGNGEEAAANRDDSTSAERDDGPSFGSRVLRPVCCHCGCVVAITLFFSSGLFYMLFFRRGIRKELPGYRYTLPWETLAVLSAMVATLNSLGHILEHLCRNKNSWALKSPVLLILSMVPVYAICSSFALVRAMGTYKVAVLFNAFREFYEAFVLVAFMQFMAEFWGGTTRLARILDTDAMVMGNVFPCLVRKLDSCLRGPLSRVEPYEHALLDLRVFPCSRAPGSDYVGWSFVGVLQYSLVMMLYVLATFVMWFWTIQGELHATSHARYEQVFKGVKAISNLWAMYNLLVLFEYLRESKNTCERMTHIRPISKFFCIKLIVLFSLWQEIIMTFLAKLDLMPFMRGLEVDWRDQEEEAKAAVNFLVCLEMVLFAQWHRYAYPSDEDWEPHEVSSYTPPWFLRLSVLKMTNDIGYLLRNRVRGQHEAVRLLAKANDEATNANAAELSDTSELHRNFLYFELDERMEASLAQLQVALTRSRVVPDWHQAEELLKEADHDSNGRLSYTEFTGILTRRSQVSS